MITIQSDFRLDIKTSATRRLRKQKKCPAIIYNHTTIALNNHDLQNPNILKHFYKNNIIKLIMNDNTSIIVKIHDIHYHHFKSEIIHIDFIKMSSYKNSLQ